jgi:hypothetical protein
MHCENAPDIFFTFKKQIAGEDAKKENMEELPLEELD